MRNKILKTVLCSVLSLCFLLLSGVVVFAEEDAAQSPETNAVYTTLKDPDGRPLCASKYGDVQNYPENSLPGVLAAAEAGADMIYISVKKTADNYIVLMADDNLSRMCVDSLGNVADKNIGEIGYHELSAYHLRNSTGYLHEAITAYTVPTLLEVVEQLGNKALLLIDGGWAFRDDIYQLLYDSNALSNAVILADGDKKEVSGWLSGKQSMPLVMGKNAGNGNAKSYASKTVSAGAVGALLSAKNPYSSVFKTGIQSAFEKSGRAVIDMTNPDLCGGREDNPTGWNDITKRGFSVLITNDPQGLQSYYARVDGYKKRLSESITRAQNIDTTLCSTKSANALQDAIAEAKTVYTDSISENELMQSNYDLNAAISALTNRTEGNDDRTVTKGRIIAVVLVVLGMVVLEVIFEVTRRKRVAKRRAAARRAEREADSRKQQ